MSDRLQGGLVCYARAVINDEWPAMRAGRSSDLTQSWIDELHQDIANTDPQGAREEAAYAQWFVTALMTAGLLVTFFLDHPYADTGGTIKPTEMQRTLTIIDQGLPAPCDEHGKPPSR